jgi:hypothetical protein
MVHSDRILTFQTSGARAGHYDADARSWHLTDGVCLPAIPVTSEKRAE